MFSELLNTHVTCMDAKSSDREIIWELTPTSHVFFKICDGRRCTLCSFVVSESTSLGSPSPVCISSPAPFKRVFTVHNRCVARECGVSCVAAVHDAWITVQRALQRSLVGATPTSLCEESECKQRSAVYRGMSTESMNTLVGAYSPSLLYC